jgi:hypothetical protein
VPIDFPGSRIARLKEHVTSDRVLLVYDLRCVRS